MAERVYCPLVRILLIPQFGIVPSQRQVADRVQPLGLDCGRAIAQAPVPIRGSGSVAERARH